MFFPVAYHFAHLLHTLSEIFHWWAVREPHKIDTLTVLNMTDLPRIDIKEYSWDTDYIMFDTLLKENKADEEAFKSSMNGKTRVSSR